MVTVVIDLQRALIHITPTTLDLPLPTRTILTSLTTRIKPAIRTIIPIEVVITGSHVLLLNLLLFHWNATIRRLGNFEVI